ncbi:MAG: aspartate--tRNA ligase [Pseudomonadota bacterium]
MLRTHTCNELGIKNASETVTLCGWVAKKLDHGSICFFHLRDRYGITQVISSEEKTDLEFHKLASSLNREDCVLVKGIVSEREAKDKTNKYATGEIEILAIEIEILTKCQTPPFEIDSDKPVGDDLRLRYRYLDLRNDKMKKNMILRHKMMDSIRGSLIDQGFLEIETPLFVRSTPEGARDFIVPSRVHKGHCYALPQSPQLYKQLLMCSGFDRYFQFATCFRDEDLRKDRAQFFTQVDLEMSFVDEEDVFNANETYLIKMFEECFGINLEKGFKKITYKDALDKYGCDKPDLRFGCLLSDVSDIFERSEFSAFKDVVQNGGLVKALHAEGCQAYSRKQIQELEEEAKLMGAKGLAFIKVTENGLEAGISKFLTDNLAKELLERTGAKAGDLLLFVASNKKIVNASLDRVRNIIGEKEGLKDKQRHEFAWIVDFPLFDYNEDEKRWDPSHHVFCMPKDDCLEYLDTDPTKVIGKVYDLVLNGVEVLSGSIRINKPELQRKVLKLIGMPEAEAQSKFGFLLEAFKYGAPPHGGSAIGFDRLVAIMAGEESIKEVIAFPNSANGTYPLDGSPSPYDEEQLKDLGLSIQK